MVNAFVSWPSAPLINSLVLKALASLQTPFTLVSKQERDAAKEPLLQWCTYDDIDHELAHARRDSVLSCSYTFRKALIRKHYLSRVLHSYLTKQPRSLLKDAVPQTFEIELSYADELDEMWTDELWELGENLDSGKSWWILKPGMADRGMDIRIFHTKDDLQAIFESFEEDSDEEAEEDQEAHATAVVTSQLRHFVIQQYIMTPLLLDPTETMDTKDDLSGRKFHLRVYCVSNGDIQLYLYDRILALFSSEPYHRLDSEEVDNSGEIDLRPHLTNTALQTEFGESNVRLLDELEGCTILSEQNGRKLKKSDISILISQVKDVLVETFKAALNNPVHFQTLPNAFELYGIDFVVSHEPWNIANAFQVKILEINAEPAIELTGPRLTWILEDLFKTIARVCVEPFFSTQKDDSIEGWKVGESQYNFIKCMDERVRGPEPTPF